MNNLKLIFCEKNFNSLEQIHFVMDGGQTVLSSIRGKTNGAFFGYGTFQLSRAVQGLCLVFAKAKLSLTSSSPHLPSSCMLTGGKGSLASSLDYALLKSPNWLLDAFGLDSRGRPIARRLFVISNSGQKRSGPVWIRLNDSFLSADAVSFELLNGDSWTAENLSHGIQLLEKQNITHSDDSESSKSETITEPSLEMAH